MAERKLYNVQDWQERFLVLRKTGLFYYESEANFKEGRPPRGKIFFFDLVRPNGAAADLVSAYLYGLLGKPYGECSLLNPVGLD